ncbi:nucleolar protein 8 [Syngnathoides biaculeatus]|uniref:nucleolar protein 8 n=1 Tax=Syngnathoides biaculeatus TaxID=300417 RepID=UPI002ADD4632|nr:nucleolar protein 8 [Syngnathoides biaculeatus]XP_061687446.1 nucleolar protein 8 [Syngnathoides biaculeatus]
MPRLYVGGLSHTVTQKDLTDRFGKFGHVEDVELRTRRDDEGVPYKTFAYINLDISDKDLNKCMTVLNKSKWKGGTLQIELAKESLLNKLARERQAEQQHPRQDADDKQQNSDKLLESLSKAGVDNFTMKAAVPGTEIPGHKNWVVSKFGRVLPVMQLRCHKGNKARTVKYDPSKYSHNIRRLAPPTDGGDAPTPVAQLTWRVDGGDNDISKKRRGEFPPYQPPKPKKTRADVAKSLQDMNDARPKQVFIAAKPESHQLTHGFRPANNQRQAQRRGRGLYEESDVDSDEEMRRLVALERPSYDAPGQDAEEDHLEVVGDDFLVAAGDSWQKRGGRPTNNEDEQEYDSADTDELFASRKHPLPPLECNSGGRTGKEKRNREERVAKKKKTALLSKEEAQEDSMDTGEISTSWKPSPPHQENISEERTGMDERAKDSTILAEEDEEEEEEEDEHVDSADSDYEAMFSNVTRLEISMADLQKLAEESRQTSEERAPRGPKVPAARVPKKGTVPEDILASLLGGRDIKWWDEPHPNKATNKGKKVTATTLPPFRGSGMLDEEALSETDAPEKNEAGEEPSEGSLSSSSSGEEETTPVDAARRPKLSAQEEEERQRKDNARRLAAVQQRLKEAQEHKKLIQGALANVDAVTARTGKHIVFDSDDEQTTVANSKIPLGRDLRSESDDEAAADDGVPTKDEEREKASAPRLFDSSEDEDDEEEDGDRFDIRPQFEGRAGQKLMELQSRFGADERFRMDSRFLEEEEKDDGEGEEGTSVAVDEDVLQEEKKRNMSIVEELLGPQRNSGRTAAKTKTFRDVSALHYDPSKEEHAAFERKVDGDQDSKSTRRKKREEAQKLPEVSKEIFYDVSGDLKAMFGPDGDSHRRAADLPETCWDRDDQDKDEERPEAEQQTGFVFSFFGDEIQTASQHAEYKAESIRAAQVLPWQQDTRLQDSSEDEEEEDEGGEVESNNAAPQNTTEQLVPSTNNFFFFRLDDTRLTEGPRWFRRSCQLEAGRHEWDERRTALRQEYRKKHKDARRKLKSPKT